MIYAITKYNTKYYNKDCGYTRDEWTDIGDIGKSFYGIIFTAEEYLKVENYYLRVIALLIKDCRKIKVDRIEKYSNDLDDKNKVPFTEKDINFYNKVKPSSQMVLSQSEVLTFTKFCLRGPLWGVINCNDFKIDFGYDFYMYYESLTPLDNKTISKIEEIGLFVRQPGF